MRYFEWIYKYRQGELSAADQQALEHEIEENPRLKAEWDALELTEALLVSTSIKTTNNSNPNPSNNSAKYRNLYLLAGLSLLALITASWLYFSISIPLKMESKPKTPASIELEWIPRISPERQKPYIIEAPIAEAAKSFYRSTTSGSTKTNENFHNEIKTATPKKPVEQSVKNIAKTLSVENADAIQGIVLSDTSSNYGETSVYTVNAVLNTVLSENSKLALTATEKITLKPGFHAKVGTTFRAKVNTGPLFEKDAAIYD